MTFEFTKAKHSELDRLTGYVGYAVVERERLDNDTVNLTVPDDRADDLVFKADEMGLKYRMV